MSLTEWFASRSKHVAAQPAVSVDSASEGLWSRCPSCGERINRKDLLAQASVCPACGYHHQIFSQERIALIADPGSFEAVDSELEPTDPLGFHDRRRYSDRLRDSQQITGLRDAVISGICRVEGYSVALGVMDFQFMAGSIGSVVGETLTRLVELATAAGLPVVIVCASGGARMHEGVFSLMQIAKISAALQRHRQAGLLYVPLLTHPTFGGATASFGMLGDLILAEPQALIGFAGRRVIEQTLREKLPEEFQTAEYLRDHGFVDLIVERKQFRSTLAELLRIHGYSMSLR